VDQLTDSKTHCLIISRMVLKCEKS
jgi:hypothetical protein